MRLLWPLGWGTCTQWRRRIWLRKLTRRGWDVVSFFAEEELVVVAEAATGEHRDREESKGESFEERVGGVLVVLVVGATTSGRLRWNTGFAESPGVVPLLLTEASPDADVLLRERLERRSRRMVDDGVFSVTLIVARFVDALAELAVAARDEPGVEETDVLEDLAADEEGARRGVVFVFEVLFHWESSVSVVPSDEGVLREREFDVTAEVVDVLFVHGSEGGFEPVVVDDFVGVKEGEYVAVGVLESRVAGGVRALNFVFDEEMHVFMGVGVFGDNVAGVVGRAVVDDDRFKMHGRDIQLTDRVKSL